MDSNGEFPRAELATPTNNGFVKLVSDRWVDTHTRDTPENGSPGKVSETRASARLEEPTFSARVAIVEDGLKHLPNAWQA